MEEEMNWVVLGVTKPENNKCCLYTRSEKGPREAFVLRDGNVVLELNPPFTREITLYLNKKNGTLGKIDLTLAHGDDVLLPPEPLSVRIGGKLFQLHAPIGGVVVDITAFSDAWRIWTKAEASLTDAANFPVSFTENPTGAFSSRRVQPVHRPGRLSWW